jgi:RecB family endonuclease NucS
LREVWKHEANDFTKWLEENLEVLSETIDVKLSNVEREKNAGDFSVDLVAEDETGNPVIIENQLGKQRQLKRSGNLKGTLLIKSKNSKRN